MRPLRPSESLGIKGGYEREEGAIGSDNDQGQRASKEKEGDTEWGKEDGGKESRQHMQLTVDPGKGLVSA